LAKRQGATVPLMIGHRLMATSLFSTGDFAEGRAHFDQTLALYDPATHRALATRFGHDVRVASLCYLSWALWFLGYPEVALADLGRALKEARAIGHAATLMYALAHTSFTHLYCGDCAAASVEACELVALANDKGAVLWNAMGTMIRGCILGISGKPADAIQ